MSGGPEATVGYNRSEVESRYAGKGEEENVANSDEKFNEDNIFLMKNHRDNFKAVKRALEAKQAEEARKNEK